MHPVRGSPLNVHRGPKPTLRHRHKSRLPLIRAFLLETESSDLVVSIFKTSQNRKKRASGKVEIIRLSLIVLWATVVIVVGLYTGLHSSHHH